MHHTWGAKLISTSCTKSNVALDLLPCQLHILRRATHFKVRLHVTWWGDDVRTGGLLDPFHSCPFWPNNQANYPIWNTNKDGDLLFRYRTWIWAPRTTIIECWANVGWGNGIAPTRGSDLGEVVSCLEDFLFGNAHIFRSAGDDENRVFPANRCLDVCVSLGTQGFNLAPCSVECGKIWNNC